MAKFICTGTANPACCPHLVRPARIAFRQSLFEPPPRQTPARFNAARPSRRVVASSTSVPRCSFADSARNFPRHPSLQSSTHFASQPAPTLFALPAFLVYTLPLTHYSCPFKPCLLPIPGSHTPSASGTASSSQFPSSFAAINLSPRSCRIVCQNRLLLHLRNRLNLLMPAQLPPTPPPRSPEQLAPATAR